MGQPSLEAVVERLERVERESRRWKVAALLAAVALASVLSMGQVRTPTLIEAERFVVKDRRRVTLAVLGTAYPVGSDVGRPTLEFISYRPDGTQAVGTFLSDWDGEAVLSLNSSLDNGSMMLRTGHGGSGATIEIAGPVGPSGRPTVWTAP